MSELYVGSKLRFRILSERNDVIRVWEKRQFTIPGGHRLPFHFVFECHSVNSCLWTKYGCEGVGRERGGGGGGGVERNKMK